MDYVQHLNLTISLNQLFENMHRFRLGDNQLLDGYTKVGAAEAATAPNTCVQHLSNIKNSQRTGINHGKIAVEPPSYIQIFCPFSLHIHISS